MDFIINCFNNVIDKFVSIPLMESFILVDGMICAFVFLKDYTIFRLTKDNYKLNIKKSAEVQENIITNYNSIYKMNAFDRYTLYLLIYFGYNLSYNFIDYTSNSYTLYFLYTKLLLILWSIPKIQNYIINIPFIEKRYHVYNENKVIFIKYSISKLIVNFVEELDNEIVKIPNYHIFLIYRLINYNYIYNIIKTYLFITLLYFLKTASNNSLYYYYKAIKVAYFYETKYLFNILDTNTSIYLVNVVIKEKRWHELFKIEVLNAFYVLIKEKFKFGIPFTTEFNITLLRIFSIWSIISFLKLFLFQTLSIHISILASSLVILYSTNNKIKNIITSIIVHFLILFNVNDIIITLIMIGSKGIYYILEEMYFFSVNIFNIRKVINKYNSINKSEYELVSN